MVTTPNLGMTLLEASQAQKEVTINEALHRLDTIILGAVLDKDVATPPASPAVGDAYIVAASPTGAWGGEAQSIAYYNQSWRFITPQQGMRVWVADEAQHYLFDGADWLPAEAVDLAAANLRLGEEGVIISASLAADFSSYVWPLLWLTTADTDPHDGGAGNPFCSLTLENTSMSNRFGEVAFSKRVSGIPTDTWSLAVDPARANVENFKLRHTGDDIVEWTADNATMRVFTNLVIDGSIGKALQSYNAAGTATLNLMRINGSDCMQFGHVSSALAGMQFQPGAGGVALEIDGASAEAWFVNRLGIGTGAAGGTAKLTVYGDGDGTDGQTIRLGKNSGVDYSIRRNTGTGTLEFEGSQVGARGFKFMSGALAVGASDADASAQLDVQSTTHGVLFPRMTITQKSAISSPAEGLIVYDTTLHKLCVYTGGAWETVTSV